MSFEADYKQGLAFSERLTKKMELQLVAAYKDALKDVRARLAEVYAKYPNKYTEMVKYGRLKKLEADIAEILKQLGNRVGKDVMKGLDTTYKATHGAIGYAMKRNVGIAYALPPQKAILDAMNLAVSGWEPVEALKKNRQYAVDQIVKVITRGYIKGDTYKDMAAAIKKELEVNLNRYALQIARSEAHKVQSLAQVDSFEYAEKKGIRGRKVWVSTLDDCTRPDHQQMDGVEADEDGLFTFPNGITRCVAPGLSGDPVQDRNCRCTVILKIDEMPEIRRDKSGIIEYRNYHDWFNAKVEGEK